jgi:hypothetical protein
MKMLLVCGLLAVAAVLGATYPKEVFQYSRSAISFTSDTLASGAKTAKDASNKHLQTGSTSSK